MKKAKLNKGSKLVCVPCGREIIIDCCGTSDTTIWCYGQPMENSAGCTNSKKILKKDYNNWRYGY